MILLKITAINKGDKVSFNKEKVEGDWEYDDYSGIVAVDGRYFVNERVYLDAKSGVGIKYAINFNGTRSDDIQPLEHDEEVRMLDGVVAAAGSESDFYRKAFLSWVAVRQSFDKE